MMPSKDRVQAVATAVEVTPAGDTRAVQLAVKASVVVIAMIHPHRQIMMPTEGHEVTATVAVVPASGGHVLEVIVKAVVMLAVMP